MTTEIEVYSYGPNLPLHYQFVEKDAIVHPSDEDEPDYGYCKQSFALANATSSSSAEEAVISPYGTLYMFRMHTSLTESKWVVENDLYVCLFQALNYHWSDSAFDEDVVVHIVPHKMLGRDPDQISIAALLKRPSRHIWDSFFEYRLSGSTNRTDADILQDIVHIWYSDHEKQSKIITGYVARYPEHVKEFRHKLLESQAFAHYQNQLDEGIIDFKMFSLDELFAMIRSIYIH